MMQQLDNVQRLLELIDAAAESSKMQRMVFIENARVVASELNKKEWAQIVKLSKGLNAIQFNMLITSGIKKPYRAAIFKGRLERFE